MLFQYRNPKQKLKPRWAKMVGLGTLLLMLTVAVASHSAVQDRRITLAEAQAMAKTFSKGSEFPITVNEAVLKQLNRYLGTPEGRRFHRARFGSVTRAPCVV